MMPDGNTNHIIALLNQSNDQKIFVGTACKKFVKASEESFQAMGYVDLVCAHIVCWSGYKANYKTKTTYR